MKKILSVLLLGFVLSTSANAQGFTPFKVELGAIYGLPLDDNFTGGVGFYLHPSYYIGDQFNVGLKGELAIIGAADVAGSSVSISAIISYLATANYYFTTGKVRPYAGLGVGLYSMGGITVSGSSVPIAEYGDKFGLAPKVGLDLSHFTLNVSYNMIFGVDSDLPEKNYLAFGIGAFFGGGKKKGSAFIGIEDDE